MAARRGNVSLDMGVRLRDMAQALQPAGVTLENFLASWQQQYPGIPLKAGSPSAADAIQL
jgi:hypothetical protein